VLGLLLATLTQRVLSISHHMRAYAILRFSDSPGGPENGQGSYVLCTCVSVKV